MMEGHGDFPPATAAKTCLPSFNTSWWVPDYRTSVMAQVPSWSAVMSLRWSILWLPAGSWTQVECFLRWAKCWRMYWERNFQWKRGTFVRVQKNLTFMDMVWLWMVWWCVDFPTVLQQWAGHFRAQYRVWSRADTAVSKFLTSQGNGRHRPGAWAGGIRLSIRCRSWRLHGAEKAGFSGSKVVIYDVAWVETVVAVA